MNIDNGCVPDLIDDVCMSTVFGTKHMENDIFGQVIFSGRYLNNIFEIIQLQLSI